MQFGLKFRFKHISKKKSTLAFKKKGKKSHTPLMRFKIIATVALSAGCNMGPITVPGFIETKSMPFSLENFHAASSAKTFEMLYHFCTTRKENQNLLQIC